MYSLYNSWPVKLVRNLAISIILILPFFEFPNSISATSDPRFKHHYFRMPEPRCGTTEAVEIVCLFIFLIDWIIRFRLIGFRRFLQQKWLVVYAILVIVSFADLFLSVSFCFCLWPKQSCCHTSSQTVLPAAVFRSPIKHYEEVYQSSWTNYSKHTGSICTANTTHLCVCNDWNVDLPRSHSNF